LHLLAAYLPGEGLVLMQMVVEKDKENKIVVEPKLLKCLDLRNIEQLFAPEKSISGTGMPTNLTAQKTGPKRLLSIVRSEWGIENGLYYRRDVTFQEDHTRMTDSIQCFSFNGFSFDS
jgi:predicted transposase YbfD/YdcC